MKRLTFCLALLALLIAGTVGAYRVIEVPEAVARLSWQLGGGAAAGGVSCDSGTACTAAYCESTAATNQFGLSNYLGQTFQVDTTGYVYSIAVHLPTVTTGGNLTLRWGPSTDLSTSYYDEVTQEITEAGYFEFIIKNTTNQVSAGNTYTWGITEGAGTDVRYGYDPGLSYAYGTERTGSTWNLSSAGGSDVRFIVRLCD